MLELIYGIISIIVFFKLMGFMFRATWGLAKIIVAIIFWPIVILAATDTFDHRDNLIGSFHINAEDG